MYLEHIGSPADLKKLPEDALPSLCEEIRSALIAAASVSGGHLASNLGAVELTVAIHRVFDSPNDKLIFDVSHQIYTHKMLTGRAGAYLNPQSPLEVSGFSSPAESEHDQFSMGHASTSISLALGLARARDLTRAHTFIPDPVSVPNPQNSSYDVLAVIGDGALSGGLAFEGLDNAAALGSGLIVIINDNEWSIAKDVGGIYSSLAALRDSKGTSPHNIFAAMGFDYRYVEEGNNVAALIDTLSSLKNIDHPVVVHVHTKKGLGYAPAFCAPEKWHHVGPFDEKTGFFYETSSPAHEYAHLTARTLSDCMDNDPRVTIINAAMPYIMGFTGALRAQAKDRFIDVGIAEEHALTFAAGLARGGAKPVVGIYGIFLQRAYDELWHDVCLNKLPVTVLVFGSSAFGTTDVTHLGYFDIAMLSNMPDLLYLAPTCCEEYEEMLRWSCTYTEGPVAIRVPLKSFYSREDYAGAAGAAAAAVARDVCRPEIVREGSEVGIIAVGDTFDLGQELTERLSSEAGINSTLINPRVCNCAPTKLLHTLTPAHRLIVTLEDGILDGGFGWRCAAALADRPETIVRSFGLPKAFIDRYDPQELWRQSGLCADALVKDIMSRL